MSAVRKPSLSDPLSLDGLEPLLDQIFAVQYEFAPDYRTVQRTNDLQPAGAAPLITQLANALPSNVQSSDAQSANEHVDFYSAEVGGVDHTRNQLLTRQLTALKEELKSFQFDCRHLQLELATKEDQLHYMPELFSKVLSLASIEAENAALKIENAALLKTIEQLKPKTHQPSMGRRILNRFFGT